MERLPKAGLVAIIAVVLLIIVILKSSVVIGAGQAGVLFKTLNNGVDTESTYGEGFHIIAPWNDMIIYPIRQLSVSDKMRVLSVNGLEVTVDGTVWYQPEYDKLPFLHQEKGRDYEANILGPAISAAARSVVGRYTPEQLYSSKRDVIQNEILEEVQKELSTQYIQVNRVLVEDVTLPTKIKSAIERKLEQEQEALEYEFRLARATKEAQRQKIDAEGKAVANKILSASLTDKILQEKGIEATLKLAESPNSKVIVVGGGEGGGLPIILGNQ
ncbi:prohibitin family protein [Nonlabens sp.]|uniref:prohibitin family protein n=1 Tax=Nonlabens sp. TaxID=1888209 RepID=UPI003F6980DB